MGGKSSKGGEYKLNYLQRFIPEASTGVYAPWLSYGVEILLLSFFRL